MGITHLILAVCTAYALVEVIEIKYLFKSRLNRKPFTCTVCMSGWLMLVLSLPHAHYLEIPFYMCTAVVAAMIFNQLINRL
jgi:hypothetical protein